MLAYDAAHPRDRRLLGRALRGTPRTTCCMRVPRKEVQTENTEMWHQQGQGVCESSKAWSAPVPAPGAAAAAETLAIRAFAAIYFSGGRWATTIQKQNATRRNNRMKRGGIFRSYRQTSSRRLGYDYRRAPDAGHHHARRCAAAKHALLQEEQAWNETIAAAGSEKFDRSTEQFSC